MLAFSPLGMGEALPSELPHLSISGRVFIGASDTVKRLVVATDSYHPPVEIAPNTSYFAHRKFDDWILLHETRDPGELHQSLETLYERGARRFVLLTQVPGALGTGEYHLPDLTAPGARFLAVNHAGSFSWEGTKFRASKGPVFNDHISVFKSFAETYALMESSAIVVPELRAGADDLIRVAIAGAVLTDPAKFTPSYEYCTHDGVCIGDEVFALSEQSLRRGKVALIGFRGAKEKKDVVLGVGLWNHETGELKWVLPSDVAESTPGICQPLLSSFCVNTEVALLRSPEHLARIVGVFAGTDRIIVERAGKYELVERATLKPLPSPSVTRGTGSDHLRSLLPRQDLKLSELLVEWVPQEVKRNGKLINPWAKCSEPKLQDHPQPLAPDGTPVKACTSDTLYYWGDPTYVDFLKDLSKERNWRRLIDGDTGLYLVTSPAATFGYGSIDGTGGLAVRIKLRPGVKYKLTEFDESVLEPTPFRPRTVEKVEIKELKRPGCSQFPASEIHDTVYIRYWSYREPPRKEHPSGAHDAGLEYVICSMAVIESWSHGTRDFYDELVRDVRRFVEGWDPPGAPSYIRRRRSDGKTEPVLLRNLTDHRPFTQRHLIQALKLQLDAAANGRGEIIPNPQAGRRAKLLREHFRSATPSWFNPR